MLGRCMNVAYFLPKRRLQKQLDLMCRSFVLGIVVGSSSLWTARLIGRDAIDNFSHTVPRLFAGSPLIVTRRIASTGRAVFPARA